MIYSVDFKELAGKISHIDMEKYLHDLGWVEIQTKREWVKIFQLEDKEDFFQVELPVSRDLRDYRVAMYRCVECIAQSTKKSIEQVILELLNPLSDIIRLRIKDPELETGSIYVEDTIRLYDNAKKLLMAAALDVVRPQLYHIGRPEQNIVDFVNSCRFGQTEIGSYVISIVCPISIISRNNVVQLSLFSEKQDCAYSLTRKVVNKLIESIRVARETINNGAFEEYILQNAESEKCISANFLDALSEISIYRSGCELDISAKYAPTIQNNTLPDASVRISHDYYTPINTVVRKIKSSQLSENAYFGRIKGLDAPPDPTNRNSGKITLVFIDEYDKKATASVTLPIEDYNAAIEAHREGKMVKVVGTLSGQMHKKINCTYFEVLA